MWKGLPTSTTCKAAVTPIVGFLKGSHVSKVLTCMKIYLYQHNFIKETDTYGYTYNTQNKVCPNKQHLSTKQHDYQSVLVTSGFGTVCVTLACRVNFKLK